MTDGARAAGESLAEVLNELAEAGYAGDLFVDEEEGTLCCRACRACQRPEEVRADSIRRLEGASDPADLSVVLAVRCPACGVQGTAVVRFGPEATAGEAELLRILDDARPAGLDVGEQAATDASD